MNFSSVGRYLKEGFKGLLKNRLMTLASILTVAACSFILIISLVLAINIDNILENAEESIGINVYLSDSLSQDGIAEIENRIKSIENIINIKYLDKKDALDWAKENWGNDEILDGLSGDENPFPRSFELTVKGAEYQGQVIADLEKLQFDYEVELMEENKNNQTDEDYLKSLEVNTQPVTVDEYVVETTTEATYEIGDDKYTYLGIESIKHAQEQSQMLHSVSDAVRAVGFILILLLCVIAVTIITNTIKLTVYIRKNEINIMKYIGATDWFIRWPFVVEGLLIGIIGSVIPVIICWLGYDGVVSAINENFSFLLNMVELKSGMEIFSFVGTVTLLMGSLLGVIGSVISIRKHLNV